MNKEDKGTITIDAYHTFVKEEKEAVAKEIFDYLNSFTAESENMIPPLQYYAIQSTLSFLKPLIKKYNYKKQ